MWELDYKESWAPKNWCFWTVVLEKTLESPLDCKEIQPVHPKGDQSWLFIGRTDVEAETPNTLATWFKELTPCKRPWCWKRLKVGGEGDDRGWDGWMASLTQCTGVWKTPGVGDGQGGLVCCSPWGHKESDALERLKWTEGLRQKGRTLVLLKRWSPSLFPLINLLFLPDCLARSLFLCTHLTVRTPGLGNLDLASSYCSLLLTASRIPNQLWWVVT